MRTVTINQKAFTISTAVNIETRFIGRAVDGYFMESLMKTPDNDYFMMYYVYSRESKPQIRRGKIVSQADVLAELWYELKHPKGSFHKMYRYSWEQ